MSRWDDPYWDYEEPPEDEDDPEDPRWPYDAWDYYDGYGEDNLEEAFLLSEDGGLWERVLL